MKEVYINYSDSLLARTLFQTLLAIQISTVPLHRHCFAVSPACLLMTSVILMNLAIAYFYNFNLSG